MAAKDGGLWDRFRGGDVEALSTVYRAHVDEVARTARAVLRDCAARTARYDQLASDLPDVVQEVFAKAFAPKIRCRLDGRREIRPYLLQMARNAAIDHWRAQSRLALVDHDRVVDRLIGTDEASYSGDDNRGGADVLAVADSFIRSLRADERRWYEAVYVRGLSQRDAAAEMGVGRQVVRTIENRVRAGIKQALAHAGLFEERPSRGHS
jgi:RNA polymerase sigma factor (sigma-70 family)